MHQAVSRWLSGHRPRALLTAQAAVIPPTVRPVVWGWEACCHLPVMTRVTSTRAQLHAVRCRSGDKQQSCDVMTHQRSDMCRHGKLVLLAGLAAWNDCTDCIKPA